MIWVAAFGLFKLFILSCSGSFKLRMLNLCTSLQVVFRRAKLSEVCIGCFRFFQDFFSLAPSCSSFFVVSMCVFTFLLFVLGCLGCVRAFQVVSRCCAILVILDCSRLFKSFSGCSGLPRSDCLLMYFSKDRIMLQVVAGGVRLF